MNPMDIIVRWFLDLFQSSGSSALEESMKQIQATPIPNLGAEWYQSLWAVNFAVAILLAITSVAINIIIASHRSTTVKLVDSIRGLFMTFALGYLLLLALYGAMYAVDIFCDLIVLMATGSTSPDWVTTLVTMKNVTNPRDAFLSEAVSWIAGNLLLTQTWIIMQSVHVFALLIVLAVSFYQNGFGEKFVRWIKAAIGTSILSKLLIITLLAIWSTVIKGLALTGVQASANVAVAMAIAALIPIGLYFSLAKKKKQKVEVEGKVQTEVEDKTNAPEKVSSVPSKPTFELPNDLTDKAQVTNTRARKVRIASDGISTVAFMAAPKAASINAAAGAVVGGIAITAKVVSSGAGKVERSSAQVLRVAPYIDDTVTFSRNVRSSAADKKARKAEGNDSPNHQAT